MPLESHLEQLRLDWIAEGACVKIVPWDSVASPEALRAKLRAIAQYADLRGALLVGNIKPKIFQYLGLGEQQGYSHLDAVDMYFADLDGVWTDNAFVIQKLTPDPNDGPATQDETRPPDGFVDNYDPKEGELFGPGPDIVIGRLLVPTGGVYGSPEEAIAKYLQKAHAYRYGGAEYYLGGMRGLAFTGYIPEYIGMDVLGLMRLFKEYDGFYDDAKCVLESFGQNLDVVHSSAGTPEELLERMQGGYGWITIGTHGSFNRFELANKTSFADDAITHGWQIGADFLHVQGCNSATLHFCTDNGYCNVLESTYLSRMIFLGDSHGLVGLGHSAEGLTACRLDVMYDGLRQGFGIGDSVINMVRQVVLDELDGNLCKQFYGQNEFMIRIIGDPFLKLY